jgi:hypothetical protein
MLHVVRYVIFHSTVMGGLRREWEQRQLERQSCTVPEPWTYGVSVAAGRLGQNLIESRFAFQGNRLCTERTRDRIDAEDGHVRGNQLYDRISQRRRCGLHEPIG